MFYWVLTMGEYLRWVSTYDILTQIYYSILGAWTTLMGNILSYSRCCIWQKSACRVYLYYIWYMTEWHQRCCATTFALFLKRNYSIHDKYISSLYVYTSVYLTRLRKLYMSRHALDTHVLTRCKKHRLERKGR